MLDPLAAIAGPPRVPVFPPKTLPSDAAERSSGIAGRLSELDPKAHSAGACLDKRKRKTSASGRWSAERAAELVLLSESDALVPSR